MDCAIARDAMLDAEVEELQGRGDTDLAAHLRTCPTCHRAAARILAGYATLDAGLAAERPRRRMPRHLRGIGIAIPLAAAAILVLVLTRPGQRFPAPAAAPAASAAPAAAPLVSAPGARGVTVMQTDDPNIVVVWIN